MYDCPEGFSAAITVMNMDVLTYDHLHTDNNIIREKKEEKKKKRGKKRKRKKFILIK